MCCVRKCLDCAWWYAKYWQLQLWQLGGGWMTVGHWPAPIPSSSGSPSIDSQNCSSTTQFFWAAAPPPATLLLTQFTVISWLTSVVDQCDTAHVLLLSLFCSSLIIIIIQQLHFYCNFDFSTCFWKTRFMPQSPLKRLNYIVKLRILPVKMTNNNDLH